MLPASVAYVFLHAGVNELRSCRAKWGFILEAALIGGCTLLMGTLVDRLGYGRYSSSLLSCLFLPLLMCTIDYSHSVTSFLFIFTSNNSTLKKKTSSPPSIISCIAPTPAGLPTVYQQIANQLRTEWQSPHASRPTCS